MQWSYWTTTLLTHDQNRWPAHIGISCRVLLKKFIRHSCYKFCMHLCLWKTLSQNCSHGEIRHLFDSKTKVKRRIQMLVSRLPDTWMANESWGRETLAQNWGHYAKLCSRQKCISVFQIYHDGEKKASDMLLLSLGCVAALRTLVSMTKFCLTSQVIRPVNLHPLF